MTCDLCRWSLLTNQKLSLPDFASEVARAEYKYQENLSFTADNTLSLERMTHPPTYPASQPASQLASNPPTLEDSLRFHGALGKESIASLLVYGLLEAVVAGNDDSHER